MDIIKEIREKGVITTLDCNGLEWYFILKDNQPIVQKIIDTKNGNIKWYYLESGGEGNPEWRDGNGY